VSYTRGERTLGLEVDLMEWNLRSRWTGAGELGWPMLESSQARENHYGEVRVGDAVLSCDSEPAWLFACPERGRYVAGYHGLRPSPLRLEFPGGVVDVPDMTIGTVVWDNGEVTIDQ
jgi:hypothetical protein